jgi:DNA-directed RNA polymerase subunit RPC12/RpoP
VNTVHFYCVLCGAPMYADSQLAGDVAECPRCNRMAPVPAPIDGKSIVWPRTWPPDIFIVEIKYPCPECEGRLGIDARWSGSLVVCPLCKKTIAVPHLGALITSSRAVKASPPAAKKESPSPRNLTPEEIDFLNHPPPTGPPARKGPDHADQT